MSLGSVTAEEMPRGHWSQCASQCRARVFCDAPRRDGVSTDLLAQIQDAMRCLVNLSCLKQPEHAE